MDTQLVNTLASGYLTAEIYSTDLPGEFKVIYRDSSGAELEEGRLTGISSYKQRESEIIDRLHQLSQGARPQRMPDRGDPGEY